LAGNRRAVADAFALGMSMLNWRQLLMIVSRSWLSTRLSRTSGLGWVSKM